ncbi:hypothetical protein TNIN_186641 [Trichonephila inaurata madagascariensis]|uniref:Uncharacterized protein n=1 Tax=Trichonephila inaurata madagascariensis TaxID=2747483 RepID=A0A8X6KCW7_9ARAC|nr:hypothetical protein TNIN_186641 [Trichonephila inaurata madagascariensis]
MENSKQDERWETHSVVNKLDVICFSREQKIIETFRSEIHCHTADFHHRAKMGYGVQVRLGETEDC